MVRNVFLNELGIIFIDTKVYLRSKMQFLGSGMQCGSVVKEFLL